ncbi:CidA/LrgA family protein [Robbsia sp. Bb-Pol-6]|uniref:CidA/LrgA family protein n=1 Tax=Robbsia betulipollinis TaxID=2981849 RepID=A0ABT3ZLV4_9BURK|nr:CidA/LrgA family protein [Robbsia betulipollinis]MCY0386928.1 CidA/LrgA family protein [Robbsia betulipollinis]
MKRPVFVATAAEGAVVPARRGLHATLRRTAAIATQVSALVAFWFVSDALVRWLHLPLPAGVVGLLLLLGLLWSGRVAPRWIKSGADWMLSEMLLFFVPAAVAIVQYGHLIENDGVRLALVVVPGTLLVMCATALAVEFGVRLERGLLLRRLRRARARRAPRAVHAVRPTPAPRRAGRRA